MRFYVHCDINPYAYLHRSTAYEHTHNMTTHAKSFTGPNNGPLGGGRPLSATALTMPGAPHGTQQTPPLLVLRLLSDLDQSPNSQKPSRPPSATWERRIPGPDNAGPTMLPAEALGLVLQTARLNRIGAALQVLLLVPTIVLSVVLATDTGNGAVHKARSAAVIAACTASAALLLTLCQHLFTFYSRDSLDTAQHHVHAAMERARGPSFLRNVV